MAEIVPTVTAFTPDEYKTQLNKIKFAKRIHPDFTDGVLAPSKTINLIQAYWPDEAVVDLHVMYQEPAQHLETIISLKPDLVVLHAEAKGELSQLFDQLKAVGIKTGLALLPETSVISAADLLKTVDHALIFGGRLGYQGSEMQKQHLTKAAEAKAIKSNLEVGWDGGVNEDNVAEVVTAGFDVINVGGYIQKADDPRKAYAKLKQIIEGVGSDRTGT